MLLILVLSSCAKIVVKDQEWCADKGPLGAHCFTTLSKNERDIKKADWDKLAIGQDHRFGKVCSDVENFTELRATILKLCKITKRCTNSFKNTVVNFVNKLENDNYENHFLQTLLNQDSMNDTL